MFSFEVNFQVIVLNRFVVNVLKFCFFRYSSIFSNRYFLSMLLIFQFFVFFGYLKLASKSCYESFKFFAVVRCSLLFFVIFFCYYFFALTAYLISTLIKKS